MSYANADIGQKLIRTSVTTEPPPPTTKKTSFFGGIRNYFSKKSTETPETSTEPNVVRAITPLPASSSSTTTSTTTLRPTSQNAASSSGNVLSQTRNNVVPPSSPATSTTARAKLPQEDFPALGPPRRQNSVPATTPSTTTLHSVWATPPTTPTSNGNRQNVNFIPTLPSPSPATSPSINIPRIEIASNSELEVLTEELFSKNRRVCMTN